MLLRGEGYGLGVNLFAYILLKFQNLAVQRNVNTPLAAVLPGVFLASSPLYIPVSL